MNGIESHIKVKNCGDLFEVWKKLIEMPEFVMQLGVLEQNIKQNHQVSKSKVS